MNSAHRPFIGLVLIALLAALAACSKPEPVAPAAAPEPAPSAPVAAPAEVPVAEVRAAVQETAASTAASAAATIAAARESLANLKLPDFKSASSQQLSALATQALTQWTQTLQAPAPALTTEVEAVKGALADDQPLAALSSLTKLSNYAKSIPGGDVLLQSSKQLVSAWALKQGFDAAKISGVLGALQSGDYAGLATQAATLFAKGGVSSEQKGLIDGVLGSFGIDAAQTGAAVNAVKGLFAK